VATDVDWPRQTLTYALEPGAPVEASIDPASGWFSWTPGLAAASTTNVATVTVTDHGSPPLTASQSFTLIVRSELHAAITSNGETVRISVPTGIGGLIDWNTRVSSPTPSGPSWERHRRRRHQPDVHG